MPIPQYVSHLGSIFKDWVGNITKPKGATNVSDKQNYQHPFSTRQGLRLMSLRHGYAEAQQTTKSDGTQNNNREFVHAAIPNSALISTMAAVADTGITEKEKKDSLVFARNLTQSFDKVIFPGDELEVTAKLDHKNKNHQYIIAEIKRGAEVVGRAIADFATLPKARLGLS